MDDNARKWMREWLDYGGIASYAARSGVWLLCLGASRFDYIAIIGPEKNIFQLLDDSDDGRDMRQANLNE